MLQRFRFTNFKSWADADVPCGRITGVFGTNSSGKTSLLQFLLLLKQTREATDRLVSLELNGDYVQLGTVGDAIHGHDETRTIDTEIAFTCDKPLTLRDPSLDKKAEPFVTAHQFTVKTRISVQEHVAQAKLLAYILGDHQFSLEPDTKRGGFSLRPSESQSSFRFVRTQGRPWSLPAPIKGYAFPDQARTYFQNAQLLSDLEAAYESAFDKVFYLGPLREYPKRDYLWARSRPTDVGQRGERTIDAILAATAANQTLNLRPRDRLKSFQAMVAHWLQHLGLIHEFRVEEIATGSNRWQARVRTRRHGDKVLLTDVGFGVSQVLPVVTLLLYVPEGSTVLLEQPEIHLHPLAQAALADLLIYAASHRNVQIMLESHSEHLLLRLQRRIAEEEILADDVKLYFCDIERGHSVLTPLQLDLFGRIENWPAHFMGDAFGETAAAEVARLNRLRNAAE